MASGFGGGLVKTMSGRRRHPDIHHLPADVQIQFEADVALDSLAERLGRVRRLGMNSQRRGGHRLGNPLCESGVFSKRSGRTQAQTKDDSDRGTRGHHWLP
jgi:hypothetical protein